MENRVYQIIRRPIITEKGLGVKETQHTVVFEVAKDATKTEIKEAVQRVFKVKVDHVRTAIFHGKFRRRGRFPQRLEEGVRATERRRKDDRVRREHLVFE
jgi:large subunit ribosomal protein L23